MEINNLSERKGMKAKFAALYIISVALIVFVASLLLAGMSPKHTTSVKRVENSITGENDVLANINGVNVQYKKLKQLDDEYSVQIINSSNTNTLATLARNIKETEGTLNKKIDSLEIIASTYSDQNAAALLSSLSQSFKSVMNDRASMQMFKTAVMSKGNASADQQAMLKMQSEIQVRNSRIATLEGQIISLQNRTTTNTSVANNSAQYQQSIDALKATVSEQEKKIANLTAANTSLERETRVANTALDESKKSADNNLAAKAQMATLERRINDLNAELRFSQVDCNLSRVDATQIISNSKQRKILLADALNTLNNLSATGDATVKRKVLEKINRLNQVASMVRD